MSSNLKEVNITENNLSTVEVKNINDSGLKKLYLSSIEVLAQSIASIAPSATPALVIPLVFATAGNGTWLAYLFATIVIVLVAANLNQFTRRSASSGSLYSFVVRGLGTNVGVVSGWALAIAYLLTASAVLCGFINYANVLLKYAGITLPAVLIGVIGALLAWIIAVKDIKLSANLMLTFEIISLVLIFILAIVVLIKHGFKFDHAQFTLKGVSVSNVGIGLVLAFFSFVGFESATSLGDEAKNPLKFIPKAVNISAIFVGVFFVILSYTQVLGFEGSGKKLNESVAPLADLSKFNGVGFFGPLISIGALISFWACFLACTNAGARILYSMGKHGIFHSSIGNIHENNKTPHIAITISTIIAAVIPFILIFNKAGLFDIYGWVGTIATYGFILNYFLISIAAPVYLYKEKELKKRNIVFSVISTIVLLIPIIGSVYANSQASPYNLFIYIFIGILVLGAIWFLIRKSQTPAISTNINENIDGVHQHFKKIRHNKVKIKA